jgi:hypothetical protein
MTQLDLSFTRPRPGDLFKPGSQNCRLLGKLFDGPITNDQIVRELHILKYTGRISEVREAVRPYLMDIEAQRMPGTSGQWVYQLKG